MTRLNKFVNIDEVCNAVVALHNDENCDDNTLNTVLKVVLSLEPAKVAEISRGYWFCPECGCVLIKDHE